MHAYFDIDKGLFTSSDIPGVTLPFVGARADFSFGMPISPLLSLVVRKDLSTRETSGTVTRSQFLDKDLVETRSYSVGGVTVGVMGGVTVDFDALVRRHRAARHPG